MTRMATTNSMGVPWPTFSMAVPEATRWSATTAKRQPTSKATITSTAKTEATSCTGGGAGNDNLWGHMATSQAYRDRAVERKVETKDNGVTKYKSVFTQASYTEAAGADDILFGGAGDDWLTGDPGQYRCSSATANGLGQPDTRLTPSPLYLAQGLNSDESTAACRALFRPPLDADAATSIRQALQRGMPVEDDRFLERACANAGIRSSFGNRGRPAVEPLSKVVQINGNADFGF